MKVLGLGTANLIQVEVDAHMRLDVARLEARLRACREAGTPVLAVVGVLGTTEFGTIDPIHEILAVRERLRAEGFDFGVHVDGAWGGYLASLFRTPEGTFRTRDAMRRHYRHFPSSAVHAAFRALADVDSITIDPHKMGYVPYCAGAFLARDRRVVDFITQKAAYVFDLGGSDAEVPMREKLRGLGQYILEGSKPGAAAASVYVTHKVLPLHKDGFGRLLSQTVKSCEAFYDRVRERAERLRTRVRIVVPFEPDTNLVCLALNPAGNTDLAEMNRFGRDVFSALKVDPGQPLQVKRFIASYTSLLHGGIPEEQASRILAELGIDARTFVAQPTEGGGEAHHIFILRHTLMNPWLLSRHGTAPDYIDRYLDDLEALIDAALDRRASTPNTGCP